MRDERDILSEIMERGEVEEIYLYFKKDINNINLFFGKREKLKTIPFSTVTDETIEKLKKVIELELIENSPGILFGVVCSMFARLEKESRK